MTQLRRQVSVLAVLLALLASACSDEPEELIVGEDTAEQSESTDAADDDDAMEGDTANDSTGIRLAVAGDSAPREVFSDPVDEGAAAFFEDRSVAWSKWSDAGIEDYDFSVAVDSSEESRVAQIEVRGGEVTRELSQSGETGNFGTITEVLEELPEAILEAGSGEGVDFVKYDPELGYPTFLSGRSDGQPASAEIYRFRTVDEYPDGCSTELLDVALPVEPDPVSTTHAALLEALQTCDWSMLAHLADQGEGELTTSFGGGGVELLWQAEKNGDALLRTLADLLSRPPAFTDDGMAVWPEEYADPDSEYLDYRVGIAADGEWLFFVAGD